VECERDGGVTLLRLARPERMNALTDEIKSELCELIRSFLTTRRTLPIDHRQWCSVLRGRRVAQLGHRPTPDRPEAAGEVPSMGASAQLAARAERCTTACDQ